MCSCFTCVTQSSSKSISSSDLLHDRKMSPWNRRGLKSICILSAILTFVFGLGIGLLLSVYFLPLKSESSISEVQAYPGTKFKSSWNEKDYERSRMSQISRRPVPSVDFVEGNRMLAFHPNEESRTKNVRRYEIRDEKFIEPISDPTVLSSKEESFKGDMKYTDGIFWSDYVESLLPPGFSDAEIKHWRTFITSSPVMSMAEGCGRMQNRLLTLANQSRACCRYRQNSDQIQGEIFSFYLSRILGLRNLPPSALSLISTGSNQWALVREGINLASWADLKPVVLTQFISDLSPANIPLQFRHSNRRLHPSDISSNVNVTELAQWSDLIIFDYLTGNLDRVVNNLYNEQWNPSMMDSPAHNLAQTPDGLLIFLDNESGLLHGYRLLDKYEVYHRLLLDSLCIFRRSTVNSIKKLNKEKSAGLLIKKAFRSAESKFIDILPLLPEKSVKILNHRINTVYNQIQKCESLYLPS